MEYRFASLRKKIKTVTVKTLKSYWEYKMCLLYKGDYLERKMSYVIDLTGTRA